ncbi:hypothetical protein JOD17_001552 [Geomicrobium sediminis]|uniref:Uncharacterized protein n=1 Tax=Geomicrobium sediminis TaxID=1347788 RepID=A0ABS2PAW3_9BACL|nr:hypothetical protein [Geomicrobium sediminis]
MLHTTALLHHVECYNLAKKGITHHELCLHRTYFESRGAVLLLIMLRLLLLQCLLEK